MKKLIEKIGKTIIVCDNKNCEYEVITDNIKKYINMPCPKCGENLLNVDDYLASEKIIKRVDFINKWFSWVTLFLPKSKKKVAVQSHNGSIKINNVKN
jgi:hypothetical protein